MNTDVIDLREMRFVHAKIPGDMILIDGYIRDPVFHRGNTLDSFPNAPSFDTIDEAFSNLPEGIENFVISFPLNDTADRLWFTQKSVDEGVISRLDHWKACYSGYKTSIYRGVAE